MLPYFGETLNFCGEPERGLELLRRSFRLEPLIPPSWEFMTGHSCYDLGRLDEAATHIAHAVERAPSFPPARLYQVATLVGLERVAEAREHIAALLSVSPRHTVERVSRVYPIRDDKVRAKFLAALARAGLPNSIPAGRSSPTAGVRTVSCRSKRWPACAREGSKRADSRRAFPSGKPQDCPWKRTPPNRVLALPYNGLRAMKS